MIDRIPFDVFSIAVLIVETVLFFMGIYVVAEGGMSRYAKACMEQRLA